MPAGGTWSAQNKKRPGAYINFNAVPAPDSTIGSAGTIITALPMDWGSVDGLIDLTGEELQSGRSIQKVGCYYNDPESLPYRMALTNCYRMLIYRANRGGAQATGNFGGVTATAKYPGIAGNDITIVVVADRPAIGKYQVSILYKGAVKETFVVEDEVDFVTLQSDWVDFEVEGVETDFLDTAAMGEAGMNELRMGVVPAAGTANTFAIEPTPTAGVALTGGTNGTIDWNTIIPEFQDIARLRDWSCMALPTTDSNAVNSTLQFINDLREVDGKMVSVALCAETYTAVAPADNEAVIYNFQGFKTETEECTPELLTLYSAGLFAGTALGESNTCREIEGAVEIVNPIADGLVEDFLDGGWFLLTYRTDGVVVIEQDLNTLKTYTLNRPIDYRKNLVIRLLNYIAQQAMLIFIRDFAGKVRNDATGRNLYKARMISFFNDLQDMGAIVNFTSDDVTVYAGEQPEGVVLEVAIQYQDAMEKLYMTVNIVA